MQHDLRRGQGEHRGGDKRTAPPTKSPASRASASDLENRTDTEQEQVDGRAIGAFKLDLIETMNADPGMTPAAFKVVVALLGFLRDRNKPVYLSTLDLMTRTGQAEKTIIEARKKAISLGYLRPSGRTSAGCFLFFVVNARESFVLDHITVAAEYRKERDAERRDRVRDIRAKKSRTQSQTAVHETVDSTETGRHETVDSTGMKLENLQAITLDNTLNSSSCPEVRDSLLRARDNSIPADPSEFNRWIADHIPDRTRHREALALLRDRKMTPAELRRLSA